MRIFVLAAALGAVALPAGAASAQSWGWGGGYRHHGGDREYRQELRECRRELRRADSRREYRRELRECRRELRDAQRYGRYDRYDGYRGHRYRPHYSNRYWDGYRWRYRW